VDGTPDEIRGRTMRGYIKLRNVNLYYGDKQALKNVNLDAAKNEITAFIGPSGCGKSTLLRVLNRMNDLIPNVKIDGDVVVAGQSLYSNEVEVEGLRKKIGMVFQAPNPFMMSIYDNIAFGPRRFGVKSKADLDGIVERSLRQAVLWDEVKDNLKKSGLSLSGGQQQRLCIARALSIEPEILLMDEATASLDPISTMKIEELVQQLKKEYTIVMVTHNMQQAARVSDQTCFFLNGEMIEASATEQLFKNPTDKRTEDYITGRFG
jgi:phosphate transport system ATP-binding protein